MAGERGTLDFGTEYAAFGIKKEAMPAWRALLDAQDKEEYYPCAKNPYYYMDYDGWGIEREDRDYWKKASLSIDDCESLCYGCPLLKQCYDFAVVNGEQYGVWGGVNFSEKDDQLF